MQLITTRITTRHIQIAIQNKILLLPLLVFTLITTSLYSQSSYAELVPCDKVNDSFLINAPGGCIGKKPHRSNWYRSRRHKHTRIFCVFN